MSTDERIADDVRIPDLPHGGSVELPGRGTTFARHISGPPGAPVVLLLHGWTANADLNFFTCYRSLGEHFRVVAIDHRGHGRGIRSRKAFRLEDCADDAAALCDAARHRAGDRRRLLDGRHDRPAAVEAPSEPRARPGAVRHVGLLPHVARRSASGSSASAASPAWPG